MTLPPAGITCSEKRSIKMFPFQMPGGGELLVIIAIIAVLFGSSRALNAAKDLGKEVYRLKKDVDDLKDEVKENITDLKR